MSYSNSSSIIVCQLSFSISVSKLSEAKGNSFAIFKNHLENFLKILKPPFYIYKAQISTSETKICLAYVCKCFVNLEPYPRSWLSGAGKDSWLWIISHARVGGTVVIFHNYIIERYASFKK